jgi:ArsR family transcriptional regulator
VFESSSVEAARLLAAVADPVRWRLLAALADGQTRCVCDLQPVAAVATNLLSYHLKVLRETGLVGAQRRGRWVDYTITGDALQRLQAAIPRSGAAPPYGESACPPDEPEPVAAPGPAAAPGPVAAPGFVGSVAR